jgi:diaminopimelate decarboxylase
MPLDSPLSLWQLEAVARQYGTPFQLYSEEAIRSNTRQLLATFGTKFPGFQQFFAVKALPNPAILALLIQEVISHFSLCRPININMMKQ